MTALLIVFLFIAAIVVGVLLGVRKLTSAAAVSECDPEWVTAFSASKYRPMLRLLDDTDHRFLASQEGVTPGMLRRLRAERRQIFRSYLRSLVSDFHRLHMAARMVLVYSTEDRPDLASALLRQRFLFAVAVLSVEAKLVLHTVGIGTVDVRNLIGSLEAMRTNIGDFASLPVAG